jgi:D-glycero-alpha-D-manno-heptose-7-phosphate kinase
MKIRALCPTRIDLAGGTLDLWPLHAFLNDCKTINAAISVYTGCEIEKIEGTQIDVEISSLKFKKTYKNLESLFKSKDKHIDILRPILRYFKNEGLKIKTFSESPVGGGLGGSSSLTISLLSAFCELNNIRMSALEMAHLAHNLEANLLRTPTGTQDYIPPILGGVNIISYNPDGIALEKVDFDVETFNKSMLVVYTGRPHHSGLNNWTVLEAAVKGSKKCLKALEGIRDTTLQLYQQLQSKTIEFKKIFKSEYEHRVRLSKSFSSPEIKRLEKMTSKKGVEAIKICGAGGGGCVVLLCKPQTQEQVKELCQKQGYRVLNAQVVHQGVSVTRIS